MKKQIYTLTILIILIILVLTMLTGCTKKKEETPFERLSNDPPDKALALIINNPTKEQLSSLQIKEQIEIDNRGDEILIIPKKINTTIQVWSIKYEKDSLVQDKNIYNVKTTDKEFVLKMKINRPEGIPAYKIIIYNGSDSNEYLFDYNGKNGTPHLEYI